MLPHLLGGSDASSEQPQIQSDQIQTDQVRQLAQPKPVQPDQLSEPIERGPVAEGDEPRVLVTTGSATDEPPLEEQVIDLIVPMP